MLMIATLIFPLPGELHWIERSMNGNRVSIIPMFAAIALHSHYAITLLVSSDVLFAMHYLLDPEIRGHDLILQILQQNIIYISDTRDTQRVPSFFFKKKKNSQTK